MSAINGVEPVSVLPNRLGVAEFAPQEVETILGRKPEHQELAAENFNWVAAYLCEEAGIFEHEVIEWFRSRARGLGERSPLAVWRTRDGFEEVFDYARQYKAQVDEDLAEEAPEPDPRELTRSHRLANHALDIIFKGFESAGADVRAGLGVSASHTIHNPDRGDRLTARWKRIGDMEDYRITRNEGAASATYYIVRHLLPGAEPMILQTGVGRHSALKDDPPLEIGSDIDGRPPSIGEVASFVVPLANEVRNNALALMR